MINSAVEIKNDNKKYQTAKAVMINGKEQLTKCFEEICKFHLETFLISIFFLQQAHKKNSTQCLVSSSTSVHLKTSGKQLKDGL